MKLKNPNGAASAKPASKKAAGKRKKADDDDDGDGKAKKKAKKGEEDEEDEDEDNEEDEEVVTKAKKKVPELLLANKWDLEKGADPTGWWISEKLDGVRQVLVPFFNVTSAEYSLI